MIPADLRYTKEHEWVRVEGDTATVGIIISRPTSSATSCSVELPDPGRALEQFAAFGVVELVKAVSDLFAPIAGEVVARNDALADRPELVNGDPYGEGWMVRVRLADADQLAELLDAAAYEELTAEA